MIEMSDLGYDEIEVGREFSFRRKLEEADLDAFAKLTGDTNPMHMDSGYAKGRGFEGRIAHGMLCAGLFSTLVGMVCPGKRNLYLSQSLNFRRPVYPGTEVTVRGTVSSKADSIKVITIKTLIEANGKVAVEGEARVKVME